MFLSARPCGPRRELYASIRADRNSFYPRGRAGRDSGKPSMITTRTGFYPRGRAGRDLSRSISPSYCTGFYPRGRAGRDVYWVTPHQWKALVSIRAAVRAATQYNSELYIEDHVSIRAAVRAATLGARAAHDGGMVSIRAAVRAATFGIVGERGPEIVFLSARPCGPRHQYNSELYIEDHVSIRAAVRAATPTPQSLSYPTWSFYPRGRAGRDTHTEADPVEGTEVSIRAAVRAATLNMAIDLGSIDLFLSARPCGPRRPSAPGGATRSGVSIRAAVRAATPAPRCRHPSHTCFYPRGRAGRDPWRRHRLPVERVSIRAAVRAATMRPAMLTGPSFQFLSARPCGPRPWFGTLERSWQKFLSARPCGPRLH